MNIKQGLKQSRESSRVENLGNDGDEELDVFFFIVLILLHVSVIILLSYLHILHQSIFKVIITILIERLHCFFHRKTGYQ